MSYNSEVQEQATGGGGFFRNVQKFIYGQEENDEEPLHEDYEPEVAPTKQNMTPIAQVRRTSSLRLEQAKQSRITVRRSIHGFEDARRAADGLKEGQQQIVNLEQTPADMSQRVIDFLNGATHALDGSVEKIGEQVYLFTPCSVIIDVEDRAASTSRPSFLDR